MQRVYNYTQINFLQKNPEAIQVVPTHLVTEKIPLAQCLTVARELPLPDSPWGAKSLYLVLVLQLLSLPPKDWIPNHLALKASRLCITRQTDFHFLAFLKIVFIYLFLPVLDLPCCVCASSSCRERRLLSRGGAWASHCCGFSCCRARALGNVGFSSCSTWHMARVLCTWAQQ